MTKANNQEGVLADFRAQAKKDLNYPPLYTRKFIYGSDAVWFKLGGNEMWVEPKFKEGKLVGLYYAPHFGGAYNWFQPSQINPKQTRKIEELFK